MNWPFLFLALVGGVFPLGMIAWVLRFAPTGDPASDRQREQRRRALSGALRRAFDAGAGRALARVRTLRRAG